MLVRLFFFVIGLSAAFQEAIWRWWYQRLATTYPKEDWKFMNYGYVPLQDQASLPLKNEDEKNRTFIQLYHHVLSGIDMKGKDVLEVGSGRGGGADYVARTFAPASLIGVDLSKNAVDLSNQFFKEPNLKFMEGNAEKLPFENERFDVVFNVESSHCYPNMDAFVKEVTRVLKPGGIFAWADLRTAKSMDEVECLFKKSPLKLISQEDITRNVSQALEQISSWKKEEIHKKVPFLWRHFFSEFAGVKNSQTYRALKNGTMVYRCYRFQK